MFSKTKNSILFLLSPLILSFFISLVNFIFRKIGNIDMPFFEIFLFIVLWVFYYVADIFILLLLRVISYIVNKLRT